MDLSFDGVARTQCEATFVTVSTTFFDFLYKDPTPGASNGVLLLTLLFSSFECQNLDLSTINPDALLEALLNQICTTYNTKRVASTVLSSDSEIHLRFRYIHN